MANYGFSDETGAWVHISRYSHPDPKMPSITLLPMIHIGEEDFFAEMNYEMWRHDTVYLEGCYMRASKLLHVFHRSLGLFTGLKTQSGRRPLLRSWKQENRAQGQNEVTETIHQTACHCGNCFFDELRAVRADLHQWHYLNAMREIPLWAKLAFPLFLLTAIITAPFINFRSMDFFDEEKQGGDRGNVLSKMTWPFWRFLIHDRDLFLRMVLAEDITHQKNIGKSVCVKYGAKHMPALANTLLQDFGYELTKQRAVLAVKRLKNQDLSQIDTGYGYASEKYWDEIDRTKVVRPTDFDLKSKIVSMTASFSVQPST